jgi:hypothetical protein
VWRTKVHRTSGFRRSGIDKVRVRHLVKSRVAISRSDLNRRSGRGHVAEDPGVSEFGISESYLECKEPSHIRKSRSAISRRDHNRPPEGRVSKDPVEIGVRHIGTLGDEKLTTGEVAKSRNATVPQS